MLKWSAVMELESKKIFLTIGGTMVCQSGAFATYVL